MYTATNTRTTTRMIAPPILGTQKAGFATGGNDKFFMILATGVPASTNIANVEITANVIYKPDAAKTIFAPMRNVAVKSTTQDFIK